MSDDMEFGNRFERSARDLFLQSHRYRHKNCHIEVPGFVVNNYPYIGASPDGIFHCNECDPQIALLEVNCFGRKKKFQPSSAPLLNKICTKTEDGSLSMVTSHAYYYQVQGQMALTGIRTCWQLGYTHKGVKPVMVKFDPMFWENMVSKMDNFYRDAFFSSS